MTSYRFLDAMGDVVEEGDFEDHTAVLAWARDGDHDEDAPHAHHECSPSLRQHQGYLDSLYYPNIYGVEGSFYWLVGSVRGQLANSRRPRLTSRPIMNRPRFSATSMREADRGSKRIVPALLGRLPFR